MEIDKFIKQQVEMLTDGFSADQVKDNVYRFVFTEGIPNIKIDTLIKSCMELYAEIVIERYKTYGN